MINNYAARLFMFESNLSEKIKYCLTYIVESCCEKEIMIDIEPTLGRSSYDLYFYDLNSKMKQRRRIYFDDFNDLVSIFKTIDHMLNDVYEHFEQERIRKNCMKLALDSIYGVRSMSNLTIENVIFNDPATIVFWSDRTKTVVKCGDDDEFDKEKGLAMAISKKFLGTNKSHSNYLDIFKKWIEKSDKENEKISEIDAPSLEDLFKKFMNPPSEW